MLDELRARFGPLADEGKAANNPYTLRIERALRWMERSEKGQDADPDPDARFIFAWIAFNALYQEEIKNNSEHSEQMSMKAFLEKVIDLKPGAVYGPLRERSQDVRSLIASRWVYRSFWKHHNNVPGFEDWERTLESRARAAERAFHTDMNERVVAMLFQQLYVLRNQLLHGGATWNSSVNREQVGLAADVLPPLVYRCIGVMLDHPEADWGKPFYPPVHDDAP